MPEQTQEPQAVPTAWVKVEVHDLVRQNAHAIKAVTGLNLDSIYRFVLHFALYHDDPNDAIVFFNTIMGNEVDNGTDNQNGPE